MLGWRVSAMNLLDRINKAFGDKLLAAEHGRYVSDEEWATIEALPGWCRREKAEALVRLIRWCAIRSCVEIGVYGGRSLHAMALGLERGMGVRLAGIDPWNPDFVHETGLRAMETCREHFARRWPGTLLLRCRSTDVLQWPEPVDLLHIDGSHVSPAPLDDLQAWYPRVKHRGYIVMDDALYAGVLEAERWLEAQGAWVLCEVIYEDCDPLTGERGGWRLYQVWR